jgi:hypothetical protein
MIRAQRPDASNTRPPLATTHRIRARHDRIKSIKKTERRDSWPVFHQHSMEKFAMTTKTSRRAILAGAATLPALAMPAIASAPIGKISFPDLATEFADLYPRWLAGMRKGAENLAAFNAKVKAATGISRDAEPPYDNDPTGYWDTLNALANKPDGDRDPVDKDGHSIVWAEIHDELFALAEEIMRQPAKSIADLALQAQVAGVINEQHWDEGLEFEPDNVCLRVLADNICKIAGVEILAGLEKQPLPEPLFSSASDDDDEDAA